MASVNYGRYTVLSATLRGVKAHLVDVEVSVFNGLPSFSIVGMPDSSIQESKDRILAAIKASGFVMPGARIVVNLAPGFIKKSGSGFDLPIAVGILAATNQICSDGLDKFLIIGELSLDGAVRAVPGSLAYALAARDSNNEIISADVSKQSVKIEGVNQYKVGSLRDFESQNFKIQNFISQDTTSTNNLDFRDITGHDVAKRALQIAACGNHGVLMVGPPGSGKTMLASRLSSILPPLSEDEKMESAVIHSIAGQNVSEILEGRRPFRSPHHSATLPGLIGGGSIIRPGEVSLAHHGVLYLDELAEFSSHVLQGIRQPMESGNVTIIRADGAVTFPAKFSLIASSNPCPCGYYGDKDHKCRCSPSQIFNYQRKIGGPVLDRIDMHLDISRIKAESVLNTGRGVSSANLLEGVLAGREFAEWRINKQKHNKVKEKKQSMEDIVNSCNLNSKDFKFFEDIASKNNMSGRGIMRVLSVARTIADISASENVLHEHLCESLTYRLQNKSLLDY